MKNVKSGSRKKAPNHLLESKKLLLDAHLNEYSRLREEMMHNLSQKATAVNFSFLALAGILTVIPSLLTKLGDYILLISTLPFFGIIWYSLSIDNMMSQISNYLKNNLIPKINMLVFDQELHQLGIYDDSLRVIEWDGHIITNKLKKLSSNLSDLAFSGGRTIMIFGPILVLTGLFVFLTKIVNPRNWTSLEYNLFWANALGLILLAVLGVILRIRYGR